MFFTILSQAFNIFLAKPVLLLYPVFVWVITQVSTNIFTGLVSGTSNTFVLVCLGIPFVILLIMLNAMPIVATTYIVYKNFQGEEVSLGDGLQKAMERFGNIFSYSLIITFVGGIFLLVSSFIQGFPATASLRFMLSIILLILALGTILVYPVIAIEDLWGLAAYYRSAELVNKTRGVVGVLFVIGLILGVVLYMWLNSISDEILYIARYGGDPMTALGIFGNPVFQFIVSILFGTFNAIFTAVWYREASKVEG